VSEKGSATHGEGKVGAFLYRDDDLLYHMHHSMGQVGYYVFASYERESHNKRERHNRGTTASGAHHTVSFCLRGS